MKPNPIKERTLLFAIKIVKFCQKLSDKKEFVISKQLFKAGTSVGANLMEAEQAESRAAYRDWETDRKSTRLNSSHSRASRMPSSA